jgi:hypothetical protein
MDIYVEIVKKVANLREEIITEIKAVLHSKGYGVGDGARCPGTNDKFEIEYDRLIINNYHTDHISTDDLVKYLRAAMHVIPRG